MNFKIVILKIHKKTSFSKFHSENKYLDRRPPYQLGLLHTVWLRQSWLSFWWFVKLNDYWDMFIRSFSKLFLCEKIIKFMNWQGFQKKLKTYYFWTLPTWICTPPRWSQWPAPGRKVQFLLQQWVLVIFFWSLVKPPPAKCLKLVHWT